MNAQKSLWRLSAFFLGAGLPLIMLGRAVTGVWLFMGILAGCYAIYDQGKSFNFKEFFKSRTCLYIVSFLVAAFAGSFFAIESGRAFGKLLELCGLGLGSILLYITYREMPTVYVHYSLKIMALATFVVAAFLCADGLLDDERLSRTLYGDRWQDPYRMQPMSNYLAVLMPFVWVFMLKKRREYVRQARLLSVPLGVMLFWVAFAAGGYNGWLAATAAMVSYLALTGSWHGVVLHRKEWLLMPLVLAGGPLLYTVTERVALSDIFAQAQLYRAPFMDYLVVSFKGFIQNPLTGVGLNNFSPLYWNLESPYAGSHQPQNFILQILTETGLLGFIPFVMLMVMLLKRLTVYAQLNLYAVAGFSSTIAFAAGSFFQTNIFHAHWLIFWIFTVVLSMRLCQPEVK